MKSFQHLHLHGLYFRDSKYMYIHQRAVAQSHACVYTSHVYTRFQTLHDSGIYRQYYVTSPKYAISTVVVYYDFLYVQSCLLRCRKLGEVCSFDLSLSHCCSVVVLAPVICGLVVLTLIPLILVAILAYFATGYIRDILFQTSVKSCIGSGSCNVFVSEPLCCDGYQLPCIALAILGPL